MAIRNGDPHDQEFYEPWMNERAVELFKQGKSIVKVCVELGISRPTYYDWRNNKDHPFSKTAKRGEEASQAYWEDRGESGIFGETDKFAGSSWQFVMKNRFREDYTDQQPQNSASDTLIEKLLEKL